LRSHYLHPHPYRTAAELSKITGHKLTHIDYGYNRAILFLSDFFHRTEPFEFRGGHEHRRINVAMLWGPKQKAGSHFRNHQPEEFSLPPPPPPPPPPFAAQQEQHEVAKQPQQQHSEKGEEMVPDGHQEV
jgi:hypothetical protein